MKILVNHLGYELYGFKQAVIQGPEGLTAVVCNLIDSNTNKTVLDLSILKVGSVDRWKDFQYWTVDFSDFSEPGRFYLHIEHAESDIYSEVFLISKNLIFNKTFSDVLAGFKMVRSSGRYDRSDCNTPFFGPRDDNKDLHGGWYDASGDTSKYLSHLSYANYMNPQQTPLVVWGLLSSLSGLEAKSREEADIFRERITEEALHGADFLVRMQDNAGYFYMILFDQWNKDTSNRMICSYTGQDGKRSEDYQAGFRQGGGMAIAALARISTLRQNGDFTWQHYLEAAERGFLHLQEHNLKYLNDSLENIIDDYCALLAASELYNTTSNESYLHAAESRAQNLINRIWKDDHYAGWWRVDSEGAIPYFHASDAGLPVISLLRFIDVAPESSLATQIPAAVKDSLNFELSVTSEVNNPFGYARQYVKGLETEYRTSFFIPHDNWSGYWWQGENARIASLAAAASMAVELFKGDIFFTEKLRKYANNQLNWILGLNPFDTCMIHGIGRNNPEYEIAWKNLPGGIVNGITAGFSDERDIDFLPAEVADKGDHRWRWSEQWLPHALWYLMAISSRGESLSS